MKNFALEAVAFDADDTLWENEAFFRMTQDRFAGLLGEYAAADHLQERLLEAERRNLHLYGFGVKGFTLSMIETALEVTDGRAPSSVVREILDFGRSMLSHPLHLIEGAEDTVRRVSETHRCLLITKGDLLDQERKLAQSGLGDLFRGVEIVSDKTAAVYARIFRSHASGPGHVLMVGNSLRSDVLPALAAGGWAAYVPHDLTWEYERSEEPVSPRYRRAARISDVLAVVEEIERG